MFTGEEDQQISQEAGSEMTKCYREANPGQIIGHYFSRKTLMEILNNPASVGGRIYYAQSKDGNKELVIVGVDADESDILINGFIGDRTYKSPPHTGAANSLNS